MGLEMTSIVNLAGKCSGERLLTPTRPYGVMNNTLDIESMVCVWGMLRPLQEGSVELDGDAGGRAGRDLEQQL